MNEQNLTPQDQSQASTPNAPQATGNDVLKILADVEGQLTRMRSAQKQQDDAISLLTARSKALRSAEDELEKKRSTFGQQSQQLDRDRTQLQQDREQFAEQCKQVDQELRRRAEEVDNLRRQTEQQRSEIVADRDNAKQGLAEVDKAKAVWEQTRKQIEEQAQRSQAEIEQRTAECRRAQDEIATQRSAWEKHRQESQAGLDARTAELSRQQSELARREGDLQKEREAIAVLDQQTRHQQASLQDKTQALEKERAELLNRVEQAERNVGDLIEQVEKTQQELIEQTRAVKSSVDKITAMQARERELEKVAEAAQRDIKRVEKESQDLLKLADGERNEISGKFQALQKQEAETREARDAAIAELESARKKVAGLQRDLKARDDEVTAKESHLADLRNKLGMAGSKLSEFSQILSEQTPQLERGAAALAMVEEQAEQIDRMTKQLAELQLASDPMEIQRRDKRIDELTDALRQSRGQNAGEAGVAEIEQNNARLEREVRDLRLELQNAQIASDEARKQLQAYVDSGAEHQVQDVAVAEHQAKIASLTAEIERLRSVAAQELEDRLSAQSKQHQQELAKVRTADTVVRQLRERIAELEQELAHAQTQIRAGGGRESEEADSDYLNRLRAKAEQITNVADHLRRRRTRLEKMRRLMRQKQSSQPSTAAQENTQIRAEQLAHIERERLHLIEVRKMLATSEAQMIRRWARQKAFVTMACIVGLMFASAGAAWLVVSQLYPAQVSAGVVLEARSRPGDAPLSDEQKQAWTEWHAGFVQDSAFQQTLAKRLTERRLDEWARVETVSTKLNKELAIDANQPGMIIYTLAGTEPEKMTTFLDAFAHTLITESNRQSSQRPDNAISVGTGERKEEGRVCYASVNPVPVSDERLTRALPVFGGTFGVLLVLALGLYIKFARSKRVFEEENAILFQEIRPAGA